MVDRTGQQLGNYRFLRSLGAGGFAEVYLGEHIHLGTRAAIKLLAAQLTNEDVERFRNEARTVARLMHPHIVRVLDFGIESKTPYLVMDYAVNGTLRQHHPKGTALALETVALYVKQLADALQYAHDLKVIHRDVKPENMLIGRNNELLLSDFGIAVVAQSSLYQRPQDMAGTIMYMAPEQIQAHPRPASDQYSLAITVYEWLTGDRPFHGSFTEIAIKQSVASPPSLRERVPTIPIEVEKIIFKALSKDPTARFASIREFAQVFEHACYAGGKTRFARPSSFPAKAWLEQPAQERNHRPQFTSPPSTGVLAEYPLPEVQSLPAGQVVATFLGHHTVVRALAWSPDSSKLVSTGEDGRVSIWNIAHGRAIWDQRVHRKAGQAVAWSPDGRYILSAGKDKTIKAIEFGIFKETVCQEHDAGVNGLSWSPDSAYFASASDDGRVCLWSAPSWRHFFNYRQHSNWVSTVAWSPDGAYLASAGYGGDVHIWRVNDGATAYIYRAHAGNVYVARWSPDARYLASAGNGGAVRVWQALTGTKVCWYSGHSERVNALSWSPDGTRIASACAGGFVHVWQVASGQHLYTYTGHTRSVMTVNWAPNSQYIASAGEDGCVSIWVAP